MTTPLLTPPQLTSPTALAPLSSSSAGIKRDDVYTDLNALESLKHNDDKQASLKKVAQQFESIFVNQMLKSMREANAVFEKDSPFNSQESQFYRDMYDKQLALTLSTGKGLGIADAMYKQLSGRVGGAPIEGSQAKHTSAAASMPVPLRSHAPSQSSTITPLTLSAVPSTSSPLSQSDVPAVNTNDKKALSGYASMAKTPNEFINALLPSVKKVASSIGLDPLVLIAQSALETGWGSKVLADQNGASSNNVFNIKAHKTWDGDVVSQNSLEYKQGRFVNEKSDFRQYDSIEKSVQDYIGFIQDNPRYQKALNVTSSASDYIQEIANAGYATDPDYADKIINVLKSVERYINTSTSPNTTLTAR